MNFIRHYLQPLHKKAHKNADKITLVICYLQKDCYICMNVFIINKQYKP